MGRAGTRALRRPALLALLLGCLRAAQGAALNINVTTSNQTAAWTTPAVAGINMGHNWRAPPGPCMCLRPVNLPRSPPF